MKFETGAPTFLVHQLLKTSYPLEEMTREELTADSLNSIDIMELKVNKTADEALQQIEDKGYAKPFDSYSRKLFKIGINFNTERRLIDDWKVVER